MNYIQRSVALIGLQAFLLVVARLPDAYWMAGCLLCLLPLATGRSKTIEAPRVRRLVLLLAFVAMMTRFITAWHDHEPVMEAARFALSQTVPWSIVLQIFLVWTSSSSWTVNRPLTAVSLPTLLGTFVLLANEMSVFAMQALVMACVPVAIWLAAPSAMRQDRVRNQSVSLERRDWLMASAYLAGVWYARRFWDGAVRQAQAVFPEWVAALDGQRRARRAYVRTGALTSITRERLSEPMQIALRVYSKRPPGYLCGRIFDSYERSQWYTSSARRGRWNQNEGRRVRTPLRRRPTGLPDADPQQPIFLIAEPTEGPYLRMEIHNDPARDEVFFLPRSVAYLQGEGSFLAMDAHGAIHTGIRTDQPYTAYVARHLRQEMLSLAMRERLLTLPAISADIQSLVASISRGSTTTEERIRAVVSYFHANYSYSDQGVVIPSGTDPLTYFLFQRPAAHCEYFATGAVILLRALNIPCRYITGYVVTELESEFGDYWLARNRNAHAWAEAFDEERNRWVMVEATPGMRLPETELTSTLDLTNDSTRAGWQVDMLGARSHWFWRIRWTNVAPAAALAIATLLAVRSEWIRSVVARPFGGCLTDAPKQRRRQALLKKFETWLSRQGHTRRTRTTLHQFAAELREQGQPGDRLDKAAQWLEQYATLRYAPTDPASQHSDPFESLQDALRELQRPA